MGSLENPKTWVPYLHTKDCSQGFCSLYCPQWCTIIFPPPPPVYPDDDSGPTFSPLVIAIIGILASAFLLVSYYAIISNYCGNMDRRENRRENHHDPELDLELELELEFQEDPSNHDQLWHVCNNGLDEALIKSITMCKYKKGDGLISCTDCSVCLGEFQEDESLRLLPKCSHAFHVYCIDTWLKSHSNCPLCRANVGCVNALPILQIPTNTNQPSSQSVILEEETSRRRDTIIEIREEENQQPIRRSVSMSNYSMSNYSCQTQISIADVLFIDQEEEYRMEECRFEQGDGIGIGSSKQSLGETSKFSNGNRVLNCAAMKRSFSSGRHYLFTIIPL